MPFVKKIQNKFCKKELSLLFIDLAMNLQTSVSIKHYPFKISHQDKIILSGSCFSENIGGKFEQHKMQVMVNPFGILYNPVSIADSFDFILSQKYFTEKDIFFHNEQWKSLYHHSFYADADKDLCLQKINDNIKQANNFLQNTNYLIITFGSSWVYRLKETGQIAGNCHKLPTSLFTKELLSIENIIEKYKLLIENIRKINPNLQILFTISPVRHAKDGFIENQVSKSILSLAVYQLTQEFKNVFYFPSYEIVIDELRDYRFFEADMLHPNTTAINYIWERFSNTFFSSESQMLNHEIQKIRQMYEHRPFNILSESFQKHCKHALLKIEELLTQFPMLGFTEEKAYFQKHQK